MASLNTEKYFKYMENDCKTFLGKLPKDLTNKEKLLYLYCFYHYVHADGSALTDVQNHLIVEEGAADKIDAIFIDADEDLNDIDLIISNYFDGGRDYDNSIHADVIKLLSDAALFYQKAIENTSFIKTREKITEFLKDKEYIYSNEHPLRVKFLTNISPKTNAQKKKYINSLNAIEKSYKNVSFQIVFGTDVELEVLEIEAPKSYVDKAEIVIDNARNIVSYGDENSLVVNISAKSLKNVYELYENRGLFSQNLRFYIKSKKIDDSIAETILENPKRFWYYNNGIILICDDYKIKSNSLVLFNFSIINGGQTTKLIGETDFEEDFYLLCKLIKNNEKDEVSKIDFIANVAEASNTQKPIKPKDATANRKEQRALKEQLAKANIYCQIKRGEKVNKKLYPETWQNTTNDEIGQLLLSFVYQLPGSARSNKASIYSDSDRYALLFDKRYDSNFLKDLLFIKTYYKKWLAFLKKDDDWSDEYKDGLTRNGMLFMVAILGTLAKLNYHPEYFDKAKQYNTTMEDRIKLLSQHDISHGFLNHGAEKFEKKFYKLFDVCYAKYFRSGYEFMKMSKNIKINAFSNFTKVNSNYHAYITNQIWQSVTDHIMFDDDLFDIFYKANEEELERDKSLLHMYVNVFPAPGMTNENITKDIKAKIVDELTKFRTKTYKAKHIKPYEVFRNVSRDVIASNAPTTLTELKKLNCLDKKTFDLYGEDIVRIVNRVLR